MPQQQYYILMTHYLRYLMLCLSILWKPSCFSIMIYILSNTLMLTHIRMLVNIFSNIKVHKPQNNYYHRQIDHSYVISFGHQLNFHSPNDITNSCDQSVCDYYFWYLQNSYFILYDKIVFLLPYRTLNVSYQNI